jgi:hypothetical protein
MLSKLVDFDRFFTRRMVPVAIAIIMAAQTKKQLRINKP